MTHFTRDLVVHRRRDHRVPIAAALREILGTEDYAQAKERVTHVRQRLQKAAPKVCELLEAAEEDTIAFYGFPAER